MSVIYSYIDTLLEKWSSWNDIFMTSQVASNISSVNDALSTTNSDNPSRAKEMFRIGLLRKELSRGIDAWQMMHNGQNVQSDLGFIAAAVNKALRITPSDTRILKAYHALCAIFSVIQSETVGHYELSINTLAIKLLKHFPVPNGRDVFVWMRYLLSAAICEVEAKNAKVLEDLLLGKSTSTTLRILDGTSTRASFSNSSQLEKVIDSNVSLTGIYRQKAALYIVGNNTTGDPQGFYGIGYKYYKGFLEAAYDEEISNLVSSPFAKLYIENNTGAKGNAINVLTNIPTTNQAYKNEINTLMKDVVSGTQAALNALAGGTSSPVNKDEYQVIYFGAPGTGKSHTLNDDIKGHPYTRVVFHPDTDYASFVGCYKPHMNGTNIEYSFKAQAFIEAYVKAWSDPQKKPYYLVIEEINRGDCAQIFGDMFQLLDRSSGLSDYAVTPDEDLKKHLATAFANTAIADQKIKNGEEMRLPENLYIRATMNTSDQSLFPMDSAFKRRWNWRYFSIKDEGKNYKIVVDDNGVKTEYDWWTFISAINEKIYSCTAAEDKQLGYYFAKLPLGTVEISASQFVSKIIFYLWNDVFKDYSKDATNAFGSSLTYSSFFDAKGNVINGVINTFMALNNVPHL